MALLSNAFKDRDKPILIAPILEDDYRLVKRDATKKVSELTLRYMLDKKLIRRCLYAVYRATSERPEDRNLTERNVIQDGTTALIEFYEGI